MGDYTRVSELDFGLMMLSWDDNNVYPLEVVSSVELTKDCNISYLPLIPKYQPDSLESIDLVTGDLGGYSTRLGLMSCIGRCWDLALKHREDKRNSI